jgi:hypothetical protein
MTPELMRRGWLILLWWLPLLTAGQGRPSVIDGYLGIRWLATPEQALTRLDGLGGATLHPRNPLKPDADGAQGFNCAIDLARVVDGRRFAVHLLFADGRFVAVHSSTPVLPGETFAEALLAVQRGLDPALAFRARFPEQLFVYDAAGGITLSRLRGEGPAQVGLAYHYRAVDSLIVAYERRLRRELAAKDSARRATIERFERDYALSFGGDDWAPNELLHGRKTAPGGTPSAAPGPPAAALPKPRLRKPTPGQRRQRAARQAWWRRTLRLKRAAGRNAGVIRPSNGMISPDPAFPGRTPYPAGGCCA